MSTSSLSTRRGKMKACLVAVLNPTSRLTIQFISALCFALFLVATIAQAFVWSDDSEETKILIGVGLWSGCIDAILGVVGFIAASKNHRKIVNIFLGTALASIASSVALIVLPALSLSWSGSSRLQPRDAASSRTWRWVLIGTGFAGLLLAVIACNISGLSIRMYDRRQRRERRFEEQSKTADSRQQSSDDAPAETDITITITDPSEEIKPEEIKESTEVEAEAEVERSRPDEVTENDSLDLDQSVIMPTEDSIPESTDESESAGYESISTTADSRNSPSRRTSEETPKQPEEPIYAIPDKRKKNKAAERRLVDQDFEIQVDDGLQQPNPTPVGPFQWQLDRWQEDDRVSSLSAASVISESKSTSSSSRIELSKDDVIIHQPPNDLPQLDLTDEIHSQSE